MYPVAYNHGVQTLQPMAQAGPSFVQSDSHLNQGQTMRHTIPQSIPDPVTQHPNRQRYLPPPNEVMFTHSGGVVGLIVSDVLKNPETFIMDDGRSMLNHQMDNGGMVQYCIKWPGYDEWVYTSFLTAEHSRLWYMRARPSTKRQLAISLAAAIQMFYEDILNPGVRPYNPAQAGGHMAWHLSYFDLKHLVLRRLRYLSPGSWEIEVVASASSLTASSGGQ